MPSAIDLRIASLFHIRQVHVLSRSEAAARKASKPFNPLVGEIIGIFAQEIEYKRKLDLADAAVVRAYQGSRDATRGGLLSMARWSHGVTTKAMAKTIPARWFRSINPLIQEDIGPVFRKLSAAANRAAILALVFPPPPATDVLQALQRESPEGMTWDDRLGYWEGQTRAQIQQTLVTGTAQGLLLNDMTKKLRTVVNRPKFWSQRIARTEGRRIAEIAANDAIDQAGDLIAGKMINEILDSVTRPHHAIRNGDIYHRTATGEFENDAGQPLPHLPDEPNCLLPGQSVSGAFEGGLRVGYAGKAVELTMAGGVSLSVTPNHRVLTVNGWVAASELREGDDLLCDRRVIERPGMMQFDENKKPPLIEDVFRTFGKGSSTRRVGMDIDFHGDEANCISEVEIVGTQGMLRGEITGAQFNEGIGEPGFMRRDMQSPLASRDSTGVLTIGRVAVAAPGFPCSAELANDLGRIFLGLTPLHSLSIGPTAQLQAHSLKAARQCGSADSSLASNLLQGLPALVTSRKVLNVRYFDYSGHVYDLQSYGWYSSSGIIIHNCRGWTSPILATPEEFEKDPAALAAFENASADTIPDPSAYDSWFSNATEPERKTAVGVGRYNAMRRKLTTEGRRPEWPDFITEEGKLIPVGQLRAESIADRAARRGKVETIIRQREAAVQAVSLTGFLPKLPNPP